jgi:branched-chain amino acid transport system ATP-binding protein
MGRKGVGKSTSIKALTGLYPVDSGKFNLHGADVTRLSSANHARRSLGHVHRGRDIFLGLHALPYHQGIPPSQGRSPPPVKLVN